MNTYKVTILNIISFKKRRLKLKAYTLENAVTSASWELSAAEEITKAELIIPKER